MTNPDHAFDREHKEKHVATRHVDAMLDEALEETYPASDPLPIQPGICRTASGDAG
jgi:hypothetical protein